MRAQSFAVIAAALLVSGCSRGSAESSGPAGGAGAVEIVTNSGVEMVYMPGRAVHDGHEPGQRRRGSSRTTWRSARSSWTSSK